MDLFKILFFNQAAIEAYNVFYYMTYENTVEFEKWDNSNDINAILDQINEYGQTPKQIFFKSHPERKFFFKSIFLLLNTM